MEQAAQARARPEGRRPPRAARADRRCAAARDRAGDGAAARGAADAQHHRSPASTRPTRRTSRSRACRRRRTRRSGSAANEVQANFDRSAGRERHLHVHDEAEHRRSTCATRRSCRRARRSSGASTSWASPSRASRSRAATAIRSSCSCPASPTSSARRRSSGRPGLLELKIVEQGPGGDAGSAAGRTARCPAGMEIVPGAGGAGRRRRARSTTWCGRRRRSPAATCATRAPSLDENNQPAVSFTLEHRGRPQVRQGHRREHRPPAGDHPRRPRAVGAAHRRRGSRPTAASPAASRRRKCRTCR